MFHTFLFCLFMWRPMGVFGDEVKSVSVMEGDSVTLHTDITEIQTDDQILWRFGPKETRIAQINKAANKISINADDLDERFRDRLQVNNQTGDLTITNINTQHTGMYYLIILSARKISYRFNVTVYGVVGDEVKSVSVMKGDSLTLHSNITEIQTDDQILWRFGPQETLLAQINKAANIVTIYDDDDLDGRFRDRLQVNNQTGDLTITNITTQHTGLYQLEIRMNRWISYRFNVTVYVRLPAPVITRDSSSVSKCVLMCSVFNVRDVRDVSLSWYKGNSLLSSISVSDLNISSISLHLECLDDSYSCVVNNPISNQTQHLNITDVCQPCSESVSCCDTTEAVIRLVSSALVGVAAVAACVVLIYDIRSRRDEQKRRS
ncbi:uncharacterized protein [Paramisgurnus dabryanus]|uniref:uncharacterized protein isoform X1 n=1 Tax=Paramisgurnus dabryanus TaxID=90735 RepID=UPI003CCFBFA3